MTKHSPMPRLIPARIALMAVLALPAMGAAAITFSSPALAVSCSTMPGCTKGSTVANKFASTTVSTAITTFRMMIETYITMLQDSLTRLANQGSNNLQEFGKTQASLGDKQVAQASAMQIGTSRFNAALQAVPSRTACGTVSNANRLSTSSYSTARYNSYATTQRNATDYASNAPGTPSARGSLQATQATFTDIMDGFCDPAIMNSPSGVNCTLANDSTGQPMAFRYTQPYQAVFGVPNGTIPPAATDGENRAARLFVRMAIEPVPTDPLRGPILSREEGRNAYMRRQADIAVINLARGALDRMVDDRIGTLTAGGESVEYLRQRAWADANGMAKDSIDRAGQPTATNVDDLAPLIADVNKIYLQIFNNFERLAAMKATHLAREVSSVPSGLGAGVTTRAVGN